VKNRAEFWTFFTLPNFEGGTPCKISVHQWAQCHITRSEFRAYVASQQKNLFRLWVNQYLLIVGLPSRLRHAWNSQYWANINSFAVNKFLAQFELEYFLILTNQRLPFVYTVYPMATTKKLVSKWKISSSSTSNRRFSNMFWWTSFYIYNTLVNNNTKLLRWSIFLNVHYTMSPTNVTAIATKAKRLKSTRQSLLQPAQPQQTYSVPYSYIPRKNPPFTNYNCNHYATACGTLAQTMTALPNNVVVWCSRYAPV